MSINATTVTTVLFGYTFDFWWLIQDAYFMCEYFIREKEVLQPHCRSELLWNQSPSFIFKICIVCWKNLPLFTIQFLCRDWIQQNITFWNSASVRMKSIAGEFMVQFSKIRMRITSQYPFYWIKNWFNSCEIFRIFETGIKYLQPLVV